MPFPQVGNFSFLSCLPALIKKHFINSGTQNDHCKCDLQVCKFRLQVWSPNCSVLYEQYIILKFVYCIQLIHYRNISSSLHMCIKHSFLIYCNKFFINIVQGLWAKSRSIWCSNTCYAKSFFFFWDCLAKNLFGALEKVSKQSLFTRRVQWEDNEMYGISLLNK